LDALELFEENEPPTACRIDDSKSSCVSMSSFTAASLNDDGEDVANESRLVIVDRYRTDSVNGG
jgi:hypothetical protein